MAVPQPAGSSPDGPTAMHANRVGLFAIVLVAACGGPKDKPPQAPMDFKVVRLEPRTAHLNIDLPATIQGQQVIEVRPKVDGYVKEILVNEGATVAKGQLLFTINNPQYEQDVRTAEASIQSAQADVDAAAMDVEKVRPLVEKDIVSKYQLQAAQYTLQAKQAALAQARAALANARTNLDYTIIRSPQAGVIGSIPYKIGALISSTSTEPLTTLSDIGNVYAYYALDEKRLLRISAALPGNTLQDKLDHMPPAQLLLADGSLYPLPGKLQTASGLVNTATGTIAMKAEFPNPQGLIRSGSTGTVRIPRTLDSALVVPQNATYELQDKLFTYVVGDSGRVHSVAITGDPTNDGDFYVVRSGLEPGDRVVVEGLVSLKNGQAIKPREVRADSLYTPLR